MCLLLLLWIRQFRERARFLNASIENVHRSRRAKKVRAQTFYPCPPPSDVHDDSNSSPSSSTVSSENDDTDFDDDAFSIDSSGYINTLVRKDDDSFSCLEQLKNDCLRNVQMEHVDTDGQRLDIIKYCMIGPCI